MDAVEYLNQVKRMCNGFELCSECPLFSGSNPRRCMETIAFYRSDDFDARMLVEKVEKWAKDHPKKTRQSELQKIITGTSLNNEGVISICPMLLTKNVPCKRGLPCADCQREYWLEEIE